MSDNHLNRHLSSAASEGRYVDQGQFYLEPRKALEKLGKFALPEPGFWVLKMVQAAVACGAPEIQFTFLRRRVEIKFVNAGRWQAEEVFTLIAEARSSQDRGLFHFQAGLVAVMGDDTESVAWSCGAKTYRYSSEKFEESADPDDGLVRVVVDRKNRSLPLDLPLRHVWRQTAYEYKALTDHCRCSPISVIVDNYELPRRYARRACELPKIARYNNEKPSGLMKLLAVRPLHTLRERPPVKYPLARRPWVKSKTKERFTTLYYESEGPTAQGVMCLLSCKQRCWEVVAVHDGVVLEVHSLPEDDLGHGAEGRRLAELCRQTDDPVVLSLTYEVKPEEIDLSHFQVKPEFYENCLPDVAVLRDTLSTIREECLKEWDFDDVPDDIRLVDAVLADLDSLLLSPLVIPALGFFTCVFACNELAEQTWNRWRAVNPKGESLQKSLDEIIYGLDSDGSVVGVS